MSHKSLRTLIENTVKSIHDDVYYFYGEESDFNQARKNETILVNLSPLTASATYADNDVMNYSKAWSVSMAFYKYDTQANVKYGEILDVTDDLVDRFINKLNQTDYLKITGMSQTAFIKALADILTGHLLSFTVTLNDDFEYCEDC